MRTLALLLAALAGLSACSRGDLRARIDHGYARMAEGDPGGALALFEASLPWLGPEDAGYLRASLGRCYALAHLQPARAREHFLALAAEEALDARAYDLMVHELVGAGAHGEAQHLARIAILTFGETRALVALRDWVAGKTLGLADPGLPASAPAQRLDDGARR